MAAAYRDGGRAIVRTAVGADEPEPYATQPVPTVTTSGHDTTWIPRSSSTPVGASYTWTPVDPPPAVEVGPGVLAVTAEQAEQVARIPACEHCGGRHLRRCPRVRRFKWHPNGALAGVEFWPDGAWSDQHVLWPDELETDE